MTTIRAQLEDSIGNPMTGYIQITLSYDLSATDGSIHTRVPAIVPLVSGVAQFNLEPSEVAQTSYYFEYFNSAVTPAVRVKDFYAAVPDQPTVLSIADLEPTGITHDAMDSSLSAITRRLYTNDLFWDRFQDNIMSLKGTWTVDTWYKRGDFVYWQGGSFVYINRLSSASNVPVLGTTTAYWTPVAAPGQPGSGTTGSLNLYDAVNWQGSTVAVSQNAVRDIVENIAAKKATVNGLAPLVNAVLTQPRLNADPVGSDNSSLIPSTAWVQQLVAQVKKAVTPIGTVSFTAASSAPAYWLVADGRAVSRAIYSDLYAVLGNLYGAGDGNTTFNLPDNRGRKMVGIDSTTIAGAAGRVPNLTAVGQNGGSATKQLSVSEMPGHNHGINDPGHTHPTQVIGAGVALAAGSNYVGSNAATGSSTTGITIQSAGGGVPFSLMSPYIGYLPIIYAGV